MYKATIEVCLLKMGFFVKILLPMGSINALSTCFKSHPAYGYLKIFPYHLPCSRLGFYHYASSALSHLRRLLISVLSVLTVLRS